MDQVKYWLPFHSQSATDQVNYRYSFFIVSFIELLDCRVIGIRLVVRFSNIA